MPFIFYTIALYCITELNWAMRYHNVVSRIAKLLDPGQDETSSYRNRAIVWCAVHGTRTDIIRKQRRREQLDAGRETLVFIKMKTQF